LSGTAGAGAREDPKEEQRPLENGSHVRPDISARLLLQLDDLTDLHRGAGAGVGGRVRHGLRAPGFECIAVDSRPRRATSRTRCARDVEQVRPSPCCAKTWPTADLSVKLVHRRRRGSVRLSNPNPVFGTGCQILHPL